MIVLTLGVGTAFPEVALAEQPSGAASTASPHAASPAPAPAGKDYALPDAPREPDAAAPQAVAVRRDPKGVTGVSPFTEALLHGDAAYLARDFALAEREYRKAVEASPHQATGHLRLAAVAAAQGRVEEALGFAEAGARFAGPDAKLRSDALRLSAFILEAGGALERAIAAWKLFATEDAKVPRRGPAQDIASAHVARIEARLKMVEQGAQVKERIKKELEAAASGQVPGASSGTTTTPAAK